jgi:predicted transcriptional regulator
MEVSLMQTVKQEVGSLLNHMPDDCSYDDIQYHLYVLQKIKKGLIDADEGNVLTHEEMEKRMSQWIRK